MRGRYEKNTKSWKKIVLAITTILAGLFIVAAISGVIFYNSMLGKINQVDVPDVIYTSPEVESNPTTEGVEVIATQFTEGATVNTIEPHIPSSADYLNILVVGQAAREGETERFADSMILFTVNTHENTLTMTSLLRDSFVKMPDYKGRIGGRIKLTTIYHLGSIYGNGIAGSMELMNLTLYDNFGIEVDHNIEIDFDAFIRIIDMLGGIDIELTEPEANYLNAEDFWVYYDVEPGVAHLDGMAALCYVRMRKAEGDGESDIIRTGRQRKFVEALLTQLRGKSVSELMDIANTVLPLITISMNNSEITELLLKFIPMLSDLKIGKGGSCPANHRGDMVDIYGDGIYHSVLRFDVAETKKHMRAITEGELP